jgi:hypothetical protein
LPSWKTKPRKAVEILDRHYSELKATARQRLGSLFNAGDYPESLRHMFSVEFDLPSVEPPDYLQQLNPQLYQQECQRVQSRFDEAVRLAQEAFTAESAKLVSHLTERLSGREDEKPVTRPKSPFSTGGCRHSAFCSGTYPSRSASAKSAAALSTSPRRW